MVRVSNGVAQRNDTHVHFHVCVCLFVCVCVCACARVICVRMCASIRVYACVCVCVYFLACTHGSFLPLPSVTTAADVDPAVRSARLRVTNIEASLSTARSEKADLQSKLAEARRQLAESTNVAAEMRALRSRYSVLSATHSEDVSKLSGKPTLQNVFKKTVICHGDHRMST